MRARRAFVAGVLAVVAALVFAACGSSSDGDSAKNVMVSGHRMSNRSTTVGDVEVKVEPRRMDGRGAMFKVAMDTHQGSLDMDMQRSRLMVDGIEWPMEQFEGDGPGGHHREGQLRFMPGGPVSRMAELTMDGFAKPVRMRWMMGSESPGTEG